MSPRRNGNRPASKLHWQVALVMSVWPIQTALTIAFLVAAGPAWFILQQQIEIRHAQVQLHQGNLEIAGLIQAIQTQRKGSTISLCLQRDVMISILRKNPGARGSRQAVVKLKKLNCRAAIGDIEKTTPPPPAAESPPGKR